jgi:cysteine desulfurase/selenocysteine lyase
LSFPTEIFDVETVRKDFPVLDQRVHGQQLIWLDNAATTQKPQVVIDRVSAYYANDNSNVHRGAHTLAARATEGYEGAREAVRRFLGAGSTEEIIFVRGTTEAINLVTQSFGAQQLQPGDEILLTTLEHHSNIVPWQLVAAATGARVRAVPISSTGEILLQEYGRMLGPRTKFVGISHVSNALGTILPVREMVDMAHRAGAWTVVDGAQAVAHFPVDVRALNADFYAFSGHKLFAPTGIGVLYGKKELLEQMPPWQGGGSMIEDVTFEETKYAGLPQKFEAGTPIIAGAIGLGAAIDYLDRLGLENIARYERALTEYATAALQTVPGLTLIGTAPEKVGVLSFIMQGIPVEHLGRFLDHYGIALRAGHHCAQPTLRAFGLESTVRPSLAVYNTTGDIDHLTEALKQAHSRSAT